MPNLKELEETEIPQDMRTMRERISPLPEERACKLAIDFMHGKEDEVYKFITALKSQNAVALTLLVREYIHVSFGATGTHRFDLYMRDLRF